MTTNKELRELAEQAGSGHWYEVGELRYHDDRSGEAHGLHHDEDGFIAAANPATVLALLDSYEALQAECEQLRNLLVEIERGCSRRDMPSEQTISSWADAIDAALQGGQP